MNYTKEFKVSFHYDLEQESKDTRFTGRKIERMVTEAGGTLLDSFEDYGMKELNFSFAGTSIESVQKTINDVLQTTFKTNVKVSANATQKGYAFVIDKNNLTDVEAFEQAAKDYMYDKGGVKVNEDYDNRFVALRLVSKEQARVVEKDFKVAMAEFFKTTEDFIQEPDIINLIELNNYTDSNKKKFSYK